MLRLLGPPRRERPWHSPPWKPSTNRLLYVDEKLFGQGSFGHNSGPTLVYGDNKACLALCSSQQTTPMSKHIHIIHCWVSEKVDDKDISFQYISSANNVSDILIKALFKPAFEDLRSKMGLRGLELWAWVGDLKFIFVMHMYITQSTLWSLMTCSLNEYRFLVLAPHWARVSLDFLISFAPLCALISFVCFSPPNSTSIRLDNGGSVDTYV